MAAEHGGIVNLDIPHSPRRIEPIARSREIKAPSDETGLPLSAFRQPQTSADDCGPPTFVRMGIFLHPSFAAGELQMLERL
jgi:hypothetical protein